MAIPLEPAAAVAAMVGVVKVVRGGTLPRVPVEEEEEEMYRLVDKGCRCGMGLESPGGIVEDDGRGKGRRK